MDLEKTLENQGWTLVSCQNWIAVKDHRPEFRKAFNTDRLGKIVGTNFYVTLTPLVHVMQGLIRQLGREPMSVSSTNGSRDLLYWGFDATGQEVQIEKFAKALAAVIDDLVRESEVEIRGSVQLHSRHYLSLAHLSSACLFAKRAGEIEASNTVDSAYSNGAVREHIACVTSTIMLAAAFLEATINEIFSDCADGHQGRYTEIPAARDMALLWKHGVPKTAKYTVLQKYNRALEVNGKRQIKESDEVAKNLLLFISLRNALIHYEPETVLAFSSDNRDPSDIHKFEKSFHNKFPLNPLTGVGNAFYPDKVLGHGCAAWTIKSAIAFSDAFFTLLNIAPMYDGVRGFLAEIE